MTNKTNNSIEFEKLNLSQDLLKSITKMGFSKATPIQAEAIPEIIAGRDVIGQASTGTGKTAAFALPAIEKINIESKDVQVLILCPTRELAMQVSGEITKFLQYKKAIKALPIYGGQPIERQLFGLRKKPQIIVGTPGRVLDHIERRTLKLHNVNMIVLDEADEMLDMGFRPDIEKILKSIKHDKRQTVLFSATMPKEVLQLAKRYQKNPKIIKVAPEKRDMSAVEQVYFDVDQTRKIDTLICLIKQHNPELAIVFCNTKRKVDKIAKRLETCGFHAEGIHGDCRQAKRDRIMKNFRSGRTNILVATDVAARGIDVANIEIVFNFEIPKDHDSYVHRIGRTGRAGKTGKAISLVSGRREVHRIRDISFYTNMSIEEREAPVLSDNYSVSGNDNSQASKQQEQAQETPERRIQKKASKIFKRVERSINGDDLARYLHAIGNFIGDHKPDAVTAALLKIVIESDKQGGRSGSFQGRSSNSQRRSNNFRRFRR